MTQDEPPTSPLSLFPATKNGLIAPVSQGSCELAFFSQIGDGKKARWDNWLILAKCFECKYQVVLLYSDFLIFSFPFTNQCTCGKFLSYKRHFLRKFMGSSISEGLNRVDLFCFFLVNYLKLLPLTFQESKKRNINVYLALKAFGRL